VIGDRVVRDRREGTRGPSDSPPSSRRELARWLVDRELRALAASKGSVLKTGELIALLSLVEKLDRDDDPNSMSIDIRDLTDDELELLRSRPR
jgi:hypothetical protein